GLSAQWELRIDGQPFAISIAEHEVTVNEGPAPQAQTFIATKALTWFAIDEGQISGPQAFMSRQLAVGGNLDLAVRFQTLFRPYKRAHRSSDLDQVDVDADGITLSAYVIGRGKPLVLLHGMGSSKLSWVPLLGPLSQTH